MASRSELIYWSFAASLVGGILILAGAIGMSLMMPLWWWGMGGHMQWMMGWDGEAPPGGFWGMGLWMGLWGLITGAVVLVGAFRVRADPDRALSWGIAIVVAGALSFLGMGGFVIGGIAALLGGALAIVAAGPRGEATRT